MTTALTLGLNTRFPITVKIRANPNGVQTATDSYILVGSNGKRLYVLTVIKDLKDC